MARTDALLLDTHVFLWWRADDRRLGDAPREAIVDAELVFVSAASAWEAAIKQALGRLELPDRFQAGVEASGFERLPVTVPDAERAGALPHHHRDLFDHMLVAQALAEHFTLVTHDAAMAAYDVPILPVRLVVIRGSRPRC